jgi:glycerol-3-phosphate acyltransferase PlsY
MILSSTFLIAILGAYIVGSIPSGYLIARYYGFQDIRQFGSGNIGATNIARALGLHFFFIVLFLDACKAYCYLQLCDLMGIGGFELLLCAFAVLIGNSYSFFLSGSGGKGVSTFVGIMCAINPKFCILLLLTWLALLIFLRVVGIASVITAFLVPIYALFFTDTYGFIFMLTVAGFILLRHRDNIRLYYFAR